MGLIDGDLVPFASGESHLGIDAFGADAFDTSSISPFGHIHFTSGIIHDPLHGQSGVLRYNHNLRAFEASADGGVTFDTVPTSGQINETVTNLQFLGLGVWRYSNTTTPPPADGGYRLNNLDPDLATELYLHYTNREGTDLTNFLSLIQAGTVLYFQEQSEASNGFLMRAASNTDDGTFATIGIAAVESFGTLTNNRNFILIASTLGTSGGGDVLPSASGAAAIGVATVNGVPIATPLPYSQIHQVSGVIHNEVGGSGILRTTLPASGLVDLEYSKTGGVSYLSLTEKSKSVTVETPTATEDIMLFHTDVAITVRQLTAVLRGTSPSVTWTLRYNSDRSATGTEVITTGTITTNTSTGEDLTVFSNPNIPADSFVWLETTAIGGTVDELALTVTFSED